MAPVPEMLLAMVLSADKSNLRVPLLVTVMLVLIVIVPEMMMLADISIV